MRIRLLPSTYAICRLDPTDAVPDWPRGEFVSISRTASELSIVCDAASAPDDVKAERDRRCFALEGPIPFEVVGVAARVTKALADTKISVFFVSTYDTDYVLVRSSNVESAITALRSARFDL
jgi:uncharacterized protein